MIGERLLPWFNFLFVWGGLGITAADQGNFAVAFSALSWRERMGRGSVVAITFHEKGVQPPRYRIAIESSRGSRRRVRTPLGGGNTDRIRSRAS